MARDCFVIGVDYGTDSVRTVILDASNGDEIVSSVFYYPRWRDGLFCDASSHQFRQHPLDYIEGLEKTITDCVSQAGDNVTKNIRAISIDTTGSTPVAVDAKGTPLALLPAFDKNPNAMFVLWKDHTAVKEAAEINNHASSFSINYLQFAGGIYSSEWFWAKLLHILRVDEDVRQATVSWVEHCDWIPFLLCGENDITQMKRGVCSAGHKALWASEFGGLPPEEFWTSLDPLLSGFRSRLYTETFMSDKPAGTLSREWAGRLGLSADTLVGIGGFDAHMGAVGGQIEPYHLSKVMGTSTCDMLVAPVEDVKGKLVKGICGQVPGSIIPGMMGMEAGQSAFGDAYAWMGKLLLWPLQNILPALSGRDVTLAPGIIDKAQQQIITQLSEHASRLPISEEMELSVDWLNGRRTPDANQSLTAAITGLNLASDAPRLFRSIVESTCFGARAIVERFVSEGIPVKGLIGLGGVSRKSAYVMQMLADVMNMPIRIHRSEQTCAAGAAMFAATVAGKYPKVENAMEAMGQGFDLEYKPGIQRSHIYAKRYDQFKKLGEFVEHGH